LQDNGGPDRISRHGLQQPDLGASELVVKQNAAVGLFMS
jgi:hypothetical protein